MKGHYKKEIGTVVGDRYRLQKIIGVGGMGAVFEANHVENGGLYALKKLRGIHLTDPRFLKRFEREVALAASLDHEGICPVVDSGLHRGAEPFLVMPLMRGESLAQRISQGRLGIAEALAIVRQVLEALDHIHRRGIVHRDLKPSNIFLEGGQGEDARARIIDFGISKVVAEGRVEDLTHSGAVLGTPNYMAPEMAKGAKRIDHRADVYAVGVILYECLTGAKPFEGESYNEVICKIASEPFSSPRSLRKEIPSALEAIVVQAMSKSPSRRFDSARDMLEALDSLSDEDAPGADVPDSTMDETADGRMSAFAAPEKETDDSKASQSAGWRMKTLSWVAAIFAAAALSGIGVGMVFYENGKESQVVEVVPAVAEVAPAMPETAHEVSPAFGPSPFFVVRAVEERADSQAQTETEADAEKSIINAAASGVRERALDEIEEEEKVTASKKTDAAARKSASRKAPRKFSKKAKDSFMRGHNGAIIATDF